MVPHSVVAVDQNTSPSMSPRPMADGDESKTSRSRSSPGPNKQKSISTKHLIEARIEARTLGFIIQSHYQIEDIIRMNL